MKQPQFSNLDLQHYYRGDMLQLDPTDIVMEHDDNLDQPYILTIQDTSYFYIEEHNRNHDFDLALAFLLESMQNEDGVSMYATIDDNEFACTIHAVKSDTDGTIYLDVMDQDEAFFCVSVKQLQAGDYDMPFTLNNLEKRTKHIRLGDYVETEFHGHKGRVTGIAQYFGDTNESDVWFTHQEPAYQPEQKMERWISILCHNGGSVMVAESRVKQIGKFAFKNPWAAEYFADHKE